MVGATDYIARMRARADIERETRLRAAARAEEGRARVVVLLTRDGSRSEELRFDHPPTLGDLVGLAGTGAYLLGIGMTPESGETRA